MYKYADLNFELMEAIDYGDRQAVKELLAEGADPNFRFPENSKYSSKTPLTFAVYLGEMGIARILLQASGVLPNDPNILIKSVQKGDIWLIKQLLEAGADVHAQNDYALRLASEYGHTEVLELLLEAGANVHADNDQALRVAAYGGHTEIIRLLVNYGASLFAVFFEDKKQSITNLLLAYPEGIIDYKKYLARDVSITSKVPNIDYKGKMTETIKNSTHFDLELLHRLRSYLNTKT